MKHEDERFKLSVKMNLFTEECIQIYDEGLLTYQNWYFHLNKFAFRIFTINTTKNVIKFYRS